MVQLGFAPEPGDGPAPFVGTRITAFPASELHREGAGKTATHALEHLKAWARRYGVHLDVDVLASSVMLAVDSPNPSGLSFEQLEVVLLGDLSAVGLELDADGRLAARLVDLVEAVFVKTGRIAAP